MSKHRIIQVIKKSKQTKVTMAMHQPRGNGKALHSGNETVSLLSVLLYKARIKSNMV